MANSAEHGMADNASAGGRWEVEVGWGADSGDIAETKKDKRLNKPKKSRPSRVSISDMPVDVVSTMAHDDWIEFHSGCIFIL